jgi:hypothetical protein
MTNNKGWGEGRGEMGRVREGREEEDGYGNTFQSKILVST